jgi:acetoin utilization deacetylase AcuC-like enzyme
VIPVVHHPDYVAPARPGSRYQWNKNGLIRDVLLASGHAVEWVEPEAMPLRWLEAVHEPDYVAEVREARVPPAKERRIGFPVDDFVARRAARVPGGTYQAALIARKRGFAANSAGGSHHALADTGAGYCVFNDLAIAAVRLVEEGTVDRLLIVDCDVHQGDGTAALTERTLLPLVESFRPELILYQAGVDPFEGDRLGRLSLSQEGLDARDRLVAGTARDHGIGLASTPGGGYGSDGMAIAERHVRSILTLGGVFGLG